jgi:hypothetical protein
MYPRIERAKLFNPLIRVEKEQNERKCLQAVFEKRTKERIVDLGPGPGSFLSGLFSVSLRQNGAI